MEKIQAKYFWRTQTKNKKIHERTQKKSIQKNVEKKKKKIITLLYFTLKLDTAASFIKDEIESFSDGEGYTDDDSEEDSVIGFR